MTNEIRYLAKEVGMPTLETTLDIEFSRLKDDVNKDNTIVGILKELKTQLEKGKKSARIGYADYEIILQKNTERIRND